SGFKPIPRVLPPVGIELPADVQGRLQKELEAVQRRLKVMGDDPRAADVAIFTKAVDFALRHREFYVPTDADKATALLAEANKRLDELETLPMGAVPSWAKATGLVVRGYKSQIDDSPQPYGLVIPEDYDASKVVPLYVWLHGRGDKSTDMHFIQERMTRPGQIAPPGAIVLHPFGRHCVGFKFAGEIDVLEAMEDVQQHYKIDPRRIVLIGFSMGGAGAWHIGAHYADRFCAISPGAGFAETARYRKLKPEDYPPEYEQKLWGLYDVPCYTRNLFNTPVIAYSGELDKQIQAARIMEEAFAKEGRTLTHLIGPGVEHKYEPETLKELLRRIEEHVKQGKQLDSDEVYIQTRTLRYGVKKWVMIAGMEQHWKDARVDGRRDDNGDWKLATANVTALRLSLDRKMRGKRLTIDEQSLDFPQELPQLWTLAREGDRWRQFNRNQAAEFLGASRKRFRQSGPIDDAFFDRFLVVLPTGKSESEPFQKWIEFESRRFLDRWRALMRGEARVKKDVDVTDEDLEEDQNLILWGDAVSNRVIAQLQEKLPVKFVGAEWMFGGQTYNSGQFVPAVIYPHPRRKSAGYVVLNSGLTFREAHDSTNSNQNPKLPDWAIIDLSQPPDASSPGKIHDAGFFDEQWQLKTAPKTAQAEKLTTPQQVWAGFDPRVEPLEIEVQKTWEEDGVVLRELTFTGMTSADSKVRVYAIYGAPKDGQHLPAVLHIHGGGQTAYAPWVKYWAQRGYASLTFNWGGKWPGRDKYTDWGNLRHANHAEVGNMAMAVDPSPQVSSWYLWNRICRRALTALETQEEVDRDRLGIFGVSMGGTIAWPFAAMDDRVKVACAIYGVGQTTYPFDSRDPDRAAGDPNVQQWRAAMEPESYASLVRCPMLFLNATNDQHGIMDRSFLTLAATKAPLRLAYTPRYRHHIAWEQGQNLSLWMDRWLKDGPSWPETPTARIVLGDDGTPRLEVRPDVSSPIERVGLFYAVENTYPLSRFWRTARDTRSGDVWSAELPVMDVQQPLYAFANVVYQSGICLSSMMSTVKPADLGAARATDQPNDLIDDFSGGIGDWVTSSPGTDPLPPVRVLVAAAKGPDGRAGLTVTLPTALMTHKVGDPKWRGPEKGSLQFEVLTPAAKELHVSMYEREFAPGMRKFTKTISLQPAAEWQTIRVQAAELSDEKGEPLTGFRTINMLELKTTPSAGAEPVYTAFRWNRD
ncbi:MAG TPA: prolyl oligopeptidase family serine peptidase, partial [Pirellulaceae bacterium]|nr:prolyl oligopeptidase family serine peptidase [Pirellulaceae bacterium]